MSTYQRTGKRIFFFTVFFMAVLLFAGKGNVQAKRKSVALNRTTVTAYKGMAPVKLKVKNVKKGKNIIWFSSKSSVAEVSQDGTVTFHKKGNAIVQAKVGKKTLKCIVSVCSKKAYKAVEKAKKLGLENFSILGANKTMPNAYKALEGSADAFLYPGHVNAITGTAVCEELVKKGVSGVVTGFTAAELLTALAVTIELSQRGEPFFRNCYPRVVKPEGNPAAIKLMEKVMTPCDSEWRGLGIIPMSGMILRDEYADFDARKKFALPKITGKPNPACRCGDVLQGKCKPSDCKVFGKVCTPLHPIGACMVSNEGACSAYYQYGNL